MSTGLDPERLSAYVDGELDPEERASLEVHLATSPEDRAAVERLRTMNVLLAAAYEAPHRAPLSPGLQRVLVKISRRSQRGRWTSVAGVGLAASIVLAAGLFFAERPTGATSSVISAGPQSPGSALHALLEAAPTGGTARLTEGTATLVSTFFDSAGRPCRELEMTDDAATFLTQAVACRVDPFWTIEVAISQPSSQAQAHAAFVTASGPGDDAIGDFLEALGAGPVLGPAEEETLMQGGWRHP